MSQKSKALRANTDREIDAAFETVAQHRIAAIAVAAGPFFDTRREKLVALAAQPCCAYDVFRDQSEDRQGAGA